MPAKAQATRTWVSGVGDDANPCSRTAPCKTFAGAISKTAAGGEIDCLDPGGFGALTITKAMTIDCTGTFGSVLVSGTNGIAVVAGSSDVVHLRGLDFAGLTGTGSPGVNGILFTSGLALYVSECRIHDFGAYGINFAPSAGNATLSIWNTIVENNTGGGIQIAPTGGFTANALVTNTQMFLNLFGLRVQDNGKATVFQSSATGNVHNGFQALSASGPAELNVSHSVTANNGTAGVLANGAAALVRIAYVSIFDNTTGINILGGAVSSFSPATNAIAGNGTDGSPNVGAIGLQ
jgi:hypothetical protein